MWYDRTAPRSLAGRPARPRRLPARVGQDAAPAVASGSRRAARGARAHLHLRQHRRAARPASGGRARAGAGASSSAGAAAATASSTARCSPPSSSGWGTTSPDASAGSVRRRPPPGRTASSWSTWMASRLAGRPGLRDEPAAAAAAGRRRHRRLPRLVLPAAGGPGRRRAAWELSRWRDEQWELMHTHDELQVQPPDLVSGHHYTSTFPASHFRHMLMLTRHVDGAHVSLTHRTVTVRRAGQPTEHREIEVAELRDLLHELAVPLTDEEEARLLDRVEQLRAERLLAAQPLAVPVRDLAGDGLVGELPDHLGVVAVGVHLLQDRPLGETCRGPAPPRPPGLLAVGLGVLEVLEPGAGVLRRRPRRRTGSGPWPRPHRAGATRRPGSRRPRRRWMSPRICSAAASRSSSVT